MKRVRIIPVLLIKNGGLIKSVKFRDYKYVGDPINAVKIFNEKEVDELVIIDIDASRENRGPDIKKITEIASEAFMPMAYGGGITTIEQIKDIFYNGIEKVIFNKSALVNPSLITTAAKLFGSQSIVVSIDVKKHFLKGHRVYSDNGKNNTGYVPEDFAKRMENAGAGEILLNNVDRDGTYSGYDYEMINRVSARLSIPLIACGGASGITDFARAIQSGASAVAAGSLFVFQRPHQAVLISYPSLQELQNTVYVAAD